MINYLIESGLCLATLLVVYKFLLEKEKMHVFNRFYLLISLVFSFCVPFIEFTITAPVYSDDTLTNLVKARQEAHLLLPVSSSANTTVNTVPWEMVLLGIYSIITFIFLFRFGRNLHILAQTTRTNNSIPFGRATLVLIPDQVLPYTFFNYIFINKQAYENFAVEPELFTHELTHVQQNHSVDIIGIELLISLFWFNPLLVLYKQAIQLNHEFLADDSVNKTHKSIKSYQHLLLSKLTIQKPILLTSNLKFNATKQRFIMMTKHTSNTKAAAIALAIFPLFGMLMLFTSGSLSAQTTPNQPNPPAVTSVSNKIDKSELNLKNGQYWIMDSKRKVERKTYAQLTEDEKQLIGEPQPFEQRKSPTPEQFEDWKNPKKFGIWLDGKHIKNNELDKYKPEDIAAFSGSYVHKNARQPQGYIYQFDLMTAAGYEKYLKEWKESPFIMIKKMK